MTNQIGKKERAKERMEELKGFYSHLIAYIGVNTVITVFKIARNMNNGEALGEAFWDFATFAIWLLWGVGLIFHAVNVFSYNPFYGKGWEKRQVQKYMDQERTEADKYK